MNKIKIGVIFGGQSSEHDVSIVSGSAVINNLDKEKYVIEPIYIEKDGAWYKYIKDIEKIDTLKIGERPLELQKIENEMELLRSLDVVFPVLHGKYGEDGTIQGMMEVLKIPCVGCGVLASSICMDKAYAKIIFENANINQAKSIVIKSINSESDKFVYLDDELNHIETTEDNLFKLIEEKLKYPVFVKPANSGSSVGVGKATNNEELIVCIQGASKHDREILIEEFINGKEVECAVLGNENPKASCVGQVIPAEEFYSYEAKYNNSESRVIIPAKIDETLSKEIKEIAIKAYKAVSGSGLARVDFFIEKETNKIYLNEINTMPGFTNISMYPKLWEQEKISYKDLLDELIRLAINKK